MNKIILLALFSLVGCAHSVHQVHMGDFNPGKGLKAGKWIQAEAQQHTIMGFVKNTDYVNQAREQLIAKCPNGDIQGVTTRYSTSLGFLNWYNKINMQGLCLK